MRKATAVLRSLIGIGIAAACSQALAGPVLPSVNAMSVGQYGDFYVYSLDLLKSCAPFDPRCQPWIADPNQPNDTTVDSGPGRVASQVVIYSGTGGGQLYNYDNASGPFANQDPAVFRVDNYFEPPTGGPSSTFDMTADIEPEEPGGGGSSATSFTGDVAGKWDAKLSTIVDFLNGGELIFLFDNNQQGTDLNQQQFFWAHLRILNGPGGTEVAHYCLNSIEQAFGTFDPVPFACDTVGPAPYDNPTTGLPKNYVEFTDYTAPGSYVGSGGRFCVDKVTGQSYLPASGVPSNDGDCGAGTSPHTPGGDGYFVSNNLGDSSAEFAAFVPHLNTNLATWAAAGYYMQIDFKMRGLNDGGEKLWIESWTVAREIPEPASLALISLGLFGLAGALRRRVA